MNDTLRKFQGVWIPADLWLDRSLSITEKVMLVEIGSLQHEVRGCFATNAHFAEFFGLSNSRVSEIINCLAQRGMIEVEMIREGRRIVERRIRMKHLFGKPNTPSENADTPFGKCGYPPSEKAEGNNTNPNNTKNNTPARSRRFDPMSAKPENVSEEAWAEWCQFRREIRKPLTATMCAQQARALDGHHNPDAVLRQSIGNGWTGIFPDKLAAQPTPGASRHSEFDDSDNDLSWMEQLRK